MNTQHNYLLQATHRLPDPDTTKRGTNYTHFYYIRIKNTRLKSREKMVWSNKF